MQIKIITAALVFAGLSAGAALAEAPKAGETSAGPTLVDAQGMTLYTWANDAKPGDATGGSVPGWHVAAP
jgi:predicted lipoprotein with Yx(FWY)xxD motif